MSPPTLTTLPPELLSNITSHLPPISTATLRLTSRTLYTLTSPAPPLSPRAWRRFHRAFEHNARLNRNTSIPLACTKCMKLLPPSAFQDSQAKRRCYRLEGRVCFRCGVMEGYYNVRDFVWKKEVCFSCFGCEEPRRREEEEKGYGGVVGLPGLAGLGTVDRRGKRWCGGCWRVVTLYVNAGMV